MSALHRTETLRRIERAWIAGLPAGTLMRRAAGAVARVANRSVRALPRATPIVGLIGPGNNGGDALLALEMLREAGFPVRALALSTKAPRAADALAVWRRWTDGGAAIEPLEALGRWLAQRPLVIDGLFGIGLDRAISGDAAAAIGALANARAPVIAVDVPSGIDADRGCIVGGRAAVAVRALSTVTMIGDKPGLHTGAALDHVGAIEVASLELERMPDGSAIPAADGELFDAGAAAPMLGARARDSHKGSFGAVLVVGGATGTTGAALLAARGAQATGAGKVFIAAPDAPVFDPGQPQLMTRSLGDGLDGVDAVCAGCGLGVGETARHALADILRSTIPAVLDADALNLVAGDPSLARRLRARSAPAVLTPHPLEAARLLACPASDVQHDRIAAALELATRFASVVVLKGAGSIVASPDGRWTIIGAGSPALASAGTGDVLAGCIAALLAQGRAADDAAKLGAWLHARAGERWQREHRLGIGLSAADLPGLLTDTINERND